MTPDKPTRHNRVREALGRIYDQHPPLFREYLRRFQEDPTSRVFAPLAEAYRRLGRIDEAIEICLEGLGHHPDFHGGRVALAKCYLDKKQFAEARVELDRVVAQVPENLLAQKLLGDTYSALKDRAASLHCYKMALLLSPGDVPLAEKVHSLEKALETATSVAVATKPSAVPAQTVPDKGDGTLVSDLPPLWEEVEAGLSPQPEGLPEAISVAPFEEEPPLTVSGPILSDEDDGMDLSAVPPEIPEDEEATNGNAEIDALLGASEIEGEEEAFKIEHVSAIFSEAPAPQKKEITTSTLADLYFSQGQYDRALRIFEKILSDKPSPELEKKIQMCRMKLGVDRASIIRAKQIESLRDLLAAVQKVRREA